MKGRKLGVFFLAAALCGYMVLGFAACNDETKEYETNSFSVYNYTDYIVLTMNFDSFDSEWIETTTLGMNTYHISCAGQIIAKRVGNYQFENASVTIRLSLGNGWGVVYTGLEGLANKHEIPLDYDGNGRYSFYCENDVAGYARFTSEDCEIEVVSASGTVRIYE